MEESGAVATVTITVITQRRGNNRQDLITQSSFNEVMICLSAWFWLSVTKISLTVIL